MSASSASSDSPPSLIEQSKRRAAVAAVDDYVTRDGMCVGIGSGSTVVYAVDRLVSLCRARGWSNTRCVPTSFQATQLITAADDVLTLSDLARTPTLDVVIDGADECDAALNLIKGGGACQTLEKLVASTTTSMVVIADYRKDSSVLGQQWRRGLPIEVLPAAVAVIQRRLRQTFGDGGGGDDGVGDGDDAAAAVGVGVLRMAKWKAGPVVTDNGNFVLDMSFAMMPREDATAAAADSSGGSGSGSSSMTPALVAQTIKQWPGVVDTGLFVDMCVRAYFGQADGSVCVCDKDAVSGVVTRSQR